MEPLAILSAGSSIIGGLGKMFGGSKMKASSATSSAAAIGGTFGAGEWNVATSGARTAGGLPFELMIVGGLVALLIWKKVK
jgi:hypothetical protein